LTAPRHIGADSSSLVRENAPWWL